MAINLLCLFNTRSNDTSIGQFLLLIAIHYHGNQLSTISEMVASYLNIKVSSLKSSVDTY